MKNKLKKIGMEILFWAILMLFVIVFLGIVGFIYWLGYTKFLS